MKALTVRQPWATAIIDGGKDVENRTWPAPSTILNRRILVLAGKRFETEVNLLELARMAGWETPRNRYAFPLGFLLGSVHVTGCHRSVDCKNRCSKWAQADQWHWVLTGARRLPHPVMWKGALHLQEIPDALVSARRLKAQAERAERLAPTTLPGVE